MLTEIKNSNLLAGGSLRSPPTRNTAKYCIYIIILSILCAKELIFYIPQEASRCSAPYRHRKMTYIVRKRIFARCGRAARAKRDFFSWIDFFCQDGSNEVSHVHGKGREVCFHPDGRTQGSREGEETLPKYIYRCIAYGSNKKF